MRRRLRRWEIGSFCLTCLLGCALRGLSRRVGECPAAAPFAAVNGSAWERMKLLYWPYLLCTAAKCPAFADALRNYFAARAAALLLGLAVIAAAGGAGPAAGTAGLVCAAGAAHLAGYRLLVRGALRAPALQDAGAVLLLGLGLLFTLWTFRAPHLPLFCDPATGLYGLAAGR